MFSYTSSSPFPVDLSSPLLDLSFDLCDASFSSTCFDEDELSKLASFINILDEDDYAFLPIFMQLIDGSHVYIGKSVEVNLSDDPENPKIVYLGDVLDELERTIGTTLLKKYVKVFTYGYTDMPSMDPNIIFHNIITKPDMKQKSRRFDPTKSLQIKEEI